MQAVAGVALQCAYVRSCADHGDLFCPHVEVTLQGWFVHVEWKVGLSGM